MRTFTFLARNGRVTVRVKHIAMVQLSEDGILTLTLLPEAGGGTLTATLMGDIREETYETLVTAMQEE